MRKEEKSDEESETSHSWFRDNAEEEAEEEEWESECSDKLEECEEVLEATEPRLVEKRRFRREPEEETE